MTPEARVRRLRKRQARIVAARRAYHAAQDAFVKEADAAADDGMPYAQVAAAVDLTRQALQERRRAVYLRRERDGQEDDGSSGGEDRVLASRAPSAPEALPAASHSASGTSLPV